jgi:hypothetical protein
MNERIKELAEQSIAEYWHQPYNDRQRILENFSDFMEIFAKSIIKEVLAVQEQLIAEGHNAWHVNKPTREHFGVE